ncbi:hypothetical protein D5S18_29285 [Nocardia panacis]|uniref:DUF8176 domain-containing protein n=2 Tax=Nocardia panacis TaxID=2340916 RepID=A0A3A4K682_9NOCA|nr:hypothetical protein D5S18_29285 [Nocardia panacis]
MLRLPAKQPQKRKRRGIGRRAPHVPHTAADPGVPSPVGSQEEWQRWLDYAPQRPAPKPEPEKVRYREPRPEAPAREEKRDLVPAIIDRTGGNRGLGLRRARRPEVQASGANRLLPVLIVLGVTVLVVSVVLLAFRASGKTKHPLAPPPPAASGAAPSSAPTTTTEPVTAVATPGCVQSRSTDVVSGTDPGGTTDGPSAILAFERAYYVQRSGYAARAVVAPDSAIPAADQIQRGINQLANGTRYCVRITRAPNGPPEETRWEVQLTQQEPGGDPQTFTQYITTRTSSTRTLLTGIAAG